MDVYDVLRELAKIESIPQLVWTRTEPLIVSVDSEKGGVGKSGLVNGLAAVAAAHGLRVLVIDFDPRASATKELGLDPAKVERSLNDVLYSDPSNPVDPHGIAEYAISPAGPGWPANVHVIPAERSLAHRETDSAMGLEHRLKFALEGVASNYDLIAKDVPPRAGGRLVGSALVASTHVITPATLDDDGVDGARDALVSIRQTQRTLNPDLRMVGVVRSIVDRKRSDLAAHFDQLLRTEFADVLIPEIAIPRYVARQESRAAQVPITDAHEINAMRLITSYVQTLQYIHDYK